MRKQDKERKLLIEAIEAIRAKRRWSQGEMATVLGMRRSYYNDIVNGRRWLTSEAIRRLPSLGIPKKLLEDLPNAYNPTPRKSSKDEKPSTIKPETQRRIAVKNQLPKRFASSIQERPEILPIKNMGEAAQKYQDLATTLQLMDADKSLGFLIEEMPKLFGKSWRTTIRGQLKKRGVREALSIGISDGIVHLWLNKTQ